jgi:hypothetical protein
VTWDARPDQGLEHIGTAHRQEANPTISGNLGANRPGGPGGVPVGANDEIDEAPSASRVAVSRLRVTSLASNRLDG